jgi:hypothetical protein
VVLIIAAVLMGMAEVLRDSAAQTFMPSLVAADQLEQPTATCGGRRWR